MLRTLTGGMIVLAACASTPSNQLAPVEPHPCTVDQSSAACAAQRDKESLAKYGQAGTAVAARKQLLEEEAAEASRVAEVAAEAEAQAERDAEAAAEAEAQAERDARAVEIGSYRRALEYGTSKRCGDSWEEDRGHYEFLRDFVSSPERDRAIGGMEACRKKWVTRARKAAPVVIANFRRAFAIAIEDAFDEANPYSKGELVAKIDGSTLSVRMKGGFEGRARHSQAEVDGWCEAPDAMMFSQITLKNSHGVFSCKPSTWKGGARTWADEVLRKDGVLEPLSKAPGSKPPPVE
jgi:hypothetical protein